MVDAPSEEAKESTLGDPHQKWWSSNKKMPETAMEEEKPAVAIISSLHGRLHSQGYARSQDVIKPNGWHNITVHVIHAHLSDILEESKTSCARISKEPLRNLPRFKRESLSEPRAAVQESFFSTEPLSTRSAWGAAAQESQSLVYSVFGCDLLLENALIECWNV